MHLPFTSEDFLNVFKTYNEAIFPMQLIFFIVALFIVLMLFRETIVKDKLISYSLSFFWLWMGIVYQIIYFSEINKAAYVFGVLFIVQGIIFFTYARVPYKMSYLRLVRLQVRDFVVGIPLRAKRCCNQKSVPAGSRPVGLDAWAPGGGGRSARGVSDRSRAGGQCGRFEFPSPCRRW